MDRARVAVIGAGPSGLSMLKTLREDGFDATLYERRLQVGGLWAYSPNPVHTTALPVTQANISKYTCGFSDFPMPDRYPHHMLPSEFQEYMEDYAKHFGLLKHIVLGADVKQVRRNGTNTCWLLEYAKDGTTTTVEVDRVAFCHGYQTKPKMPTFEGQELFTGTIIHSQAFRGPTRFKDKKVLVVGFGATAGDVIPTLMPHAAKVYASHRRGAILVKRYRNGTPSELLVTWRRRQYTQFMQKYLPTLTARIADLAIPFLTRRYFGKLDPAWHLEPAPSITTTLPGTLEFVVPFLRDGSLTLVQGVKRFTGPKSIEFADGTILDDIDAVICCTGYSADWSAAPFVETSVPNVEGYRGPPMYRLWMNMFPPAFADSCALLCYSQYGKNNGFSFGDVTAMAVSNVWRGVEPLPSRDVMEKCIDDHQRWGARRWLTDPLCDTSAVKNWEFQAWLHRVAQTGMENVGWGWKGWSFWWRDRKMYNLIAHGVETAHCYRYFDSPTRRHWPGAREAIIHVNQAVKDIFPIEDEDIPKPQWNAMDEGKW